MFTIRSIFLIAQKRAKQIALLFCKYELFCLCFFCGGLNGCCLGKLFGGGDEGDQREDEEKDRETDHYPARNKNDGGYDRISRGKKRGKESKEEDTDEDLDPLLLDLILPAVATRENDSHDGERDQIDGDDDSDNGSLHEDQIGRAHV